MMNNYMPDFTPPSNNVRLINTLIISLATLLILFLTSCGANPEQAAAVQAPSLPVITVQASDWILPSY